MPELAISFRSRAEHDGFLLHYPQFKLPDVDYSRHTSMLVSFGPQPSGMIPGSIVCIEDLGDKLKVYPVLWLPPPMTPITADVRSPYVMATIDKTDKPIEFAETLQTNSRLRPGPN